MTGSPSKKIVEDQGDRILMKMSELFQSMEMLGSRMDSGSATWDSSEKRVSKN